jgi:D-beta-D-heptose 7-phosphate kinase/D-beta-D-heptose 1-phosphate adenosyltransferase
VLVVSDYAKGLVGPVFCQEVLRLARQADVPVVIDPRPRNAGCYIGCDYLTPNWKEAQALVGDLEGPPTAAAVSDVGRRLAERFDANVLLTLGAQGIRFFGRDGSQTFDEPARAREVFDVSGAGDTVVAAFALALAAGADIQASLRLANLAAGVVVAKVGTATVSPGELTAEAEGDERLIDRASLAHHARELRSAGRRVVTVLGAFEAIRPGTLDLLREAKRHGDVLVVGLRGGTDDVQARARVLIGLRDVDFVHVIDDQQWFFDALRPDAHFEESTPADAGSTVR